MPGNRLLRPYVEEHKENKVKNVTLIDDSKPFCPGCGVKAGAWHRFGCKREQCPYCGRHLWKCLAEAKECPVLRGEVGHPWPPPLDDRLRWDGQEFGVDECL